MPIVEVGMMRVQPGKTPMAASTPDGALLNHAWKAVTSAPGGPQRVYWGVEEEEEEEEEEQESSTIWAFFDWNSLDEHEGFAKSFGGEATKRFGQVFTPGFTKHAALDISVLKGPGTEVVTAFFPSATTRESKDVVANQVRVFIDKTLKKSPAFRGVSSGWGLEDDFPIPGSTDGEKGCLFFALVGWESVEEAKTAKGVEELRDLAQMIVEFEGCIKIKRLCLKCELMEREA